MQKFHQKKEKAQNKILTHRDKNTSKRHADQMWNCKI